MYEEKGKGNTKTEESKMAGEINKESKLKEEGRDMERLKKE